MLRQAQHERGGEDGAEHQAQPERGGEWGAGPHTAHEPAPDPIAPAAYAPTLNLPALIEALPSDDTRPQQESCAAGTGHAGHCPQCASPLPGAEPVPASAEGAKFTRARQVEFLSALSVSGAVRRAVRAAGVSHQTAYRARRACREFRLAWDAALLAARAVAEEELASRAIDGIEEAVFYHGEEIARRRRYDSRLLLAHLARLDGLVDDARVHDFAEDWDEALARFERGEAQPEAGDDSLPTSVRPEPVEGLHFTSSVTLEERAGLRQAQPERGGEADPDFSLSGQCNTRSMSPPETPAREWWDTGEIDEDIPIEARIAEAMDAARPAGAPLPEDLCDEGDGEWDVEDIEDWQSEAFAERVERWWLVVPPLPGDDPEEWHYAEWEEGAEREAEVAEEPVVEPA